MQTGSDELSRTLAVEMALYNRWQNEGLYAVCAGLGEGVVARDLELFFGSILATLDHVFHTDRVLVRYMKDGRPPDHFDPRHRHHEEFPSLRGARRSLDAELETLFRAAPAGWLAEEVCFYSERLGRERRIPRAFFATQLFNHQTHHRSQVTSALHRRGVDYGETDLPANPLSQF